MSRFFKVTPGVLLGLHTQVRELLGQPNAFAEEPFLPDGDFSAGGFCYVALPSHHVLGSYTMLIDGDPASGVFGLADTSGVTEITAEVYFSEKEAVSNFDGYLEAST